ncbi:MAG: hypothetical protein ACUVSU_09240 [Aggregatilineaceae bacterium]
MRRIPVRRDDLLLILLAALSVIVYVGSAAHLNEVGYPLDDAWIHQTYARNLAEHGEWAFVPGQPSSASTAPLFSVLLSPAYILGLSHFVWTFGVGVLALGLAGCLNARLADRLWAAVPGARLWTGVLTVLSWHNVWAAASGMETMLFGMLALAMIWVTWVDAARLSKDPAHREMAWRGARAGGIAAALTLTRPEGLGLVMLSAALMVLAQGHVIRLRWRQILAWGGGLLFVWLAICMPVIAFNWQVNDTLLPDTAAAKQAEYAPISEQWSLVGRLFRIVIPLMAGHLTLLIPGILTTTLILTTRARRNREELLYSLPLLWALAHIGLYAWRLPANYQHGRYLMPALSPLLLTGVGGTLLLVKRWNRSLTGRVLSRSLALSVPLVTLGFWSIGARQYGQDVRIINSEMVTTAQWVDAHLPPERLLAVHDIGALGYFAPRPIFDLAGLVSPEVIPLFRNGEGLMRLMCDRGVVYLMVMPDQRPVPPEDPRLGRIIFTTNAPYAPAAGGGNMMIYEMAWPEGCVW